MITVNQNTISDDQILHEMQYHPAKGHRAAMVDAAQSLIIGELLLQRVHDLNLETGFTADEAMSEEQKQNALLDLLIAKEVQIPQATEQECHQYYQQNQEKFSTPPLLAARHILLAAPGDDEQARTSALQTAEQILEALTQGASFAELAKQYSKCPSAEVGGQLGQLSRNQTVSEFERPVFKAEVGLIPYPVETRFGYHVVYVDHKEPGRQLPFEVVHTKISEYLNQKVERKAIAQYIQLLIGDAEIEGFDFDVSSSPLVQ